MNTETLDPLEVYHRSVYGQTLIYPASDDARTLANIAGTTTLTDRVLDQARSIGFTVRRVPDPLQVRRDGLRRLTR